MNSKDKEKNYIEFEFDNFGNDLNFIEQQSDIFLEMVKENLEELENQEIKDKLQQMLLEIIFDELGLETIEQSLLKAGIKSKEIYNSNNEKIVSNYFFLCNDVMLENLNVIELNRIKRYFEQDNISMKDKKEFKKFIDSIKLKLLIENSEESYINWGYDPLEHSAPSDAIVLACHYLEFSDEDFTDEKDELLCKELNKIQEELAPKAGLKVAVLRFNDKPLSRNIIM